MMVFRLLLIFDLWLLNYWLFKHASTLSVWAFTAFNILGSVLALILFDIYGTAKLYGRKNR